MLAATVTVGRCKSSVKFRGQEMRLLPTMKQVAAVRQNFCTIKCQHNTEGNPALMVLIFETFYGFLSVKT